MFDEQFILFCESNSVSTGVAMDVVGVSTITGVRIVVSVFVIDLEIDVDLTLFNMKYNDQDKHILPMFICI
ncbi:hypothetical protein MAR_012180 [Mya arenaria]|uniref:Uncharacterized protein n=1 Tax=Mya arenaria TaxID=6604 RepID=A0ABY7G081_MYAAR|nr:hypothetical protein MAR_012180 [Mya arenaria]